MFYFYQKQPHIQILIHYKVFAPGIDQRTKVQYSNYGTIFTQSVMIKGETQDALVTFKRP